MSLETQITLLLGAFMLQSSYLCKNVCNLNRLKQNVARKIILRDTVKCWPGSIFVYFMIDLQCFFSCWSFMDNFLIFFT